MTGGGLYSAGRGSREYPGHELTNSVRVLPHLLLSVFLSGGALFIRHNRRASGAHYISHRMLYDMNGVRQLRCLFQHQVASACPSRTSLMIADFTTITDNQ